MQLRNQKNSGATLALVLVFLLILTVLGVSSMSDSIIQQKSSTNLYLENEAFHIAESAVSATIYDSVIEGNEFYGAELDDDISAAQGFCVGSNGYIAALGATDPDTNENLCDNIDSFEGIESLKASSIVEYLQCVPCPGFEKGVFEQGGVGCNAWKITGTGEVGEKTRISVDSWVLKVATCFNASDDLDLTIN